MASYTPVGRVVSQYALLCAAFASPDMPGKKPSRATPMTAIISTTARRIRYSFAPWPANAPEVGSVSAGPGGWQAAGDAHFAPAICIRRRADAGDCFTAAPCRQPHACAKPCAQKGVPPPPRKASLFAPECHAIHSQEGNKKPTHLKKPGERWAMHLYKELK